MDEAAFQAFLQGAQGGANPDDILGFQKNIMASNPYRMAAAPILGTRFDTSSWSPGTALAATAAQSFLGSVLQGLGQRKEAQQMGAVAQALPSLYADPLKAQAPEGVPVDAFNALRGNVYSRQAKSKYDLQNQLAKDLFGVEIAGLTEQSKERGRLSAQNESLKATQANLMDMPTEDDSGPSLGVPSLEDEENRIYRERLKIMPPTQAAVSAREQIEGKRKRGKDMFGKKLDAASDTISQMEDLIRKGDEGVLKAGKTGSKIASLYESFLSTFSPFDTPEADRQAQGDKALELTQNLGTMINRIVGSGALSDFESKALFATAMSPTNTNAQNEMILRNYKNGLSAAKEHRDFMSYFADKTGGNPEKAQTLWEIYKREQPIIIAAPDGSQVLNEARKPWQQFDFGDAYKRFLKGDIPTDSQPQQAVPAEIAQQFSGKKILSVKRIR